jgi:hypothetical protein
MEISIARGRVGATKGRSKGPDEVEMPNRFDMATQEFQLALGNNTAHPSRLLSGSGHSEDDLRWIKYTQVGTSFRGGSECLLLPETVALTGCVRVRYRGPSCRGGLAREGQKLTRSRHGAGGIRLTGFMECWAITPA